MKSAHESPTSSEVDLRRARWLSRRWSISRQDNEYLNADGYNVVIFPWYDGWRFVITSIPNGVPSFSKYMYRTADEAKRAAADEIFVPVYPCYCIQCGRGMDYDLIWCNLCYPGARPDRYGTPRISETIIDNRSVREHLRIAARNHIDAAAREGRRLSEEQIADVMLNMARHLVAVVGEFRLARVAPQLTGGTPDELREVVYAMVGEEARNVIEQEDEIDQMARRDGWGDREAGAAKERR